jgi:hypothetical protein
MIFSNKESLIPDKSTLKLFILFASAIQVKVSDEPAQYFFQYLSFFTLLFFSIIFFVKKYKEFIFYFENKKILSLMSCVAIIFLWPSLVEFVVMGYGREVKDMIYSITIYSISVYVILSGFIKPNYYIDVPKLFKLIVIFTLLNLIIAFAMIKGFQLDLFGEDYEFVQNYLNFDYRLYGLLGTPTHYAPFIAISLIYILVYGDDLKQSFDKTLRFKMSVLISPLIYYLIMILLVYGLIKTGSRSSIYAFIGALIIYFIYILFCQRSLRTYLASFLILFVLSLGFLLYQFNLYESESLRFAFRTDENYHASRFNIWLARIIDISNMNLFPFLIGSTYKLESYPTFNQPLGILFSYGLIYLTFFYSIFFAILLNLFYKAFLLKSKYFLFMLMIGVFYFLFGQGISFFLASHFHIVMFILTILFLEQFLSFCRSRFNKY